MKIKENINPYIFREYDLRGVYPIDIDEDTAYTIGLAFGSYIQNIGQNTCFIGHDNRLSSVSLDNALVTGILETGANVIHLGLVTTPMYYYAQILNKVPAGIMITASHNPKDDNGFKIAFDESGNARGQMIYDFRDFILGGNFRKGQGTLTECDIEKDYLELMKNSIDFGNKKLKVILDCANGTTSIIARKAYELFPIDLEILFEESDATFPNHHPDPAVEKNVEGLKKRVIETKADCGIAFDGDGDRVGIIDEKGNYIPIDKFMIIICRDIIPHLKDKRILFDVKCSKALEDEIKKLGGEPYMYRTGNSYTKAKVLEENMAFGGELSGHVFFNDKFPGFDSGIYAGLRLLEILSKTDKTVSQLLEGINHYYNTEELKFKTTDEKKLSIVEKVKQYCDELQYNYLQIDGIKVQFEDSWALVRASNTGPNITARFEANTEARLQELIQEFTKIIEENK